MWDPYRTRWCNCLIAFFPPPVKRFCFLSARQEPINTVQLFPASLSMSLFCTVWLAELQAWAYCSLVSHRMNGPADSQWGHSRVRRANKRVNSIFLESGTCRAFFAGSISSLGSPENSGCEFWYKIWSAHIQKRLLCKSYTFKDILGNNCSLKFQKDREIGGCRVLDEGCGLETEHKSGPLSLQLSPSSSSSAHSTRAHSLHPRPSNLSAEAERAEWERRSMNQVKENFDKSWPNIGHHKAILYLCCTHMAGNPRCDRYSVSSRPSVLCPSLLAWMKIDVDIVYVPMAINFQPFYWRQWVSMQD